MLFRYQNSYRFLSYFDTIYNSQIIFLLGNISMIIREYVLRQNYESKRLIRYDNWQLR